MGNAEKPRIRMTMRDGKLVPVNPVYEGATRSRRMSSRPAFATGPNMSVARSLPLLQSRSQHAIRNNAYAVGAKEAYVSNLVGKGIRPNWRDSEIQDLWDTWANECDADGGESFYGLESMVTGAQFESGECLTRFRLRRPSDGLSVPLQLQVMESAQLDPNYTRLFGDSMIKMGIEFNGIGRRSAFHLWRFHPHEKLTSQINSRVAIPARDIVHMYRRQRPGQLRGVPELTPVLVTLYGIDKMQDSTLARQTLAQMFGAFVSRKPAADDDEFPEFGDAISNHELEDDEDRHPDGEDAMEFTSGAIHYLEDGETVTFSDPPDIGGAYEGWLRTELLRVFKGAGVTYEQGTGDLKGVNFSSIRAGLLEFRRRAEALQAHLIVHQWCKPIGMRFLDTAIVSGALTRDDYWENRAAYHRIDWIAPKWEWVDPLKEVTADLLEVRAGFKPRSEAAAERGWDLASLDAAIDESNRSADELGLILDSDPRTVNKSGALQVALDQLNNNEPEGDSQDGQES